MMHRPIHRLLLATATLRKFARQRFEAGSFAITEADRARLAMEFLGLAFGMEFQWPVLERTLMNLGSCASSDVSMKSSELYRNHKERACRF